MKKKDQLAIAKETAKHIKTGHNLNELRQILTKTTIVSALNANLDKSLGYEKAILQNGRNGYPQ